MQVDVFAAWLEAYKLAWEEGDPVAAGKLFTQDAIYEETPFTEPMHGRDAIQNYWREGPQDAQRDIRFSYEVLAVSQGAGICRWRCSFVRIPNGEAVDFDGIFHCVFADDGRCSLFQEWWHRRSSIAAT